VERVEKEEKLKTIKISQENHARLTKLAGTLQSLTGNNISIDDALTYLFQNQKERNQNEEKTENGT
jgi:hypothetical protein